MRWVGRECGECGVDWRNERTPRKLRSSANTQSTHSTTDLYRINCRTRPHRCASTAAHRETRYNRIPQQVFAACDHHSEAAAGRRKKTSAPHNKAGTRSGAAGLRSVVSDQNKHACSSGAEGQASLHSSCAVRLAFRWNKKRSCLAANPSPCHRQLRIMHGTRGIPNSPSLTSRCRSGREWRNPNQAGGEENRLIYHSKS